MNLKNVLTAAAAILIFSSAAGAAQTPTRMNQFNAWGTYSYSGSDGKICYVLSTPTKMTPANVDAVRKRMFLDFCAALETNGIPYVILSGYQGYPDRIDSDIDFMLD